MLLPGERELRDLVDLLPPSLDDADLVHARFEELCSYHERRLRLTLLLALGVILVLVLTLTRAVLPPLDFLQSLLLTLITAVLLGCCFRSLLRRLPPAHAHLAAQQELARSWESLPTAALHLRMCVEAGVHRRVAIALGIPDAPGLGTAVEAPHGHGADELQGRAAEVACTFLREGFTGTLTELVEAARACVDES